MKITNYLRLKRKVLPNFGVFIFESNLDVRYVAKGMSTHNWKIFPQDCVTWLQGFAPFLPFWLAH